MQGIFFLKQTKFTITLDKFQKKTILSHVAQTKYFMATASQLLAKLKTLQYSGSTKPYSDAVSLIETTYRTQAYTLLEKSVSEAAAVGISIELKGLGTLGGGYSYVDGADIYMPTVPAQAYPSMDIMTYFLFETRNATRAIRVIAS
jgi:hypothetical protein